MVSKRLLLPLSALFVAIFAVFAFVVPLPYTIIVPGSTADTLGTDQGREVVRIEGAPTYPTTGKLLLTTILATDPDTTIRMGRVVDAWWDGDESVVPRKSVYPEGKSVKEIVEINTADMVASQNHAVMAALGELGLSPQNVKVTLDLADVGGPSAGLMFSLGIVDKLNPENLTGGRVVAGTGTIDDRGNVGAVGGVPMKLKAAVRDGATVFLVPRDECDTATRDKPGGLRLVPVETLDDAIASLRALDTGGRVPSC